MNIPSFITYDKLHNIEAEKTLLGLLLTNNSYFDELNDILNAEYFFLNEHQAIFKAIKTLIDKGRTATPVSLKNHFLANETLKDLGNTDYLFTLAETTSMFIAPVEYAKILKDLYKRRKFIEIVSKKSTDIAKFAVDDSADIHIDEASQELYNLSQNTNNTEYYTFEESLKKSIEVIQETSADGITGVPTGLTALDNLIGGLHKSDLIVLAGRPGMGKTALAINIGYNAAHQHLLSKGKRGAGVIFFSLEMSADQITTRILSRISGVRGDEMRRGKVDQGGKVRIQKAFEDIKETPFFIDDTGGTSVSQIRSKARRLMSQNSVGLIMIDYIQLIGSSSNKYSDNRNMEVSSITRELKTLAKEFEIPILALSQLSRAVEARPDKRPNLSDLRDSGSIEQDADIVSFIFRQAYYTAQEEPKDTDGLGDDEFQRKHQKWKDKLEMQKYEAQLIISKNRHGETKTLDLGYIPETSTFGDKFESKR